MNRAIIHDFDTLLNTKTWVAAHRAADALIEHHPQRVLTIRYEDFLSNQEATLKQVCAFFDIDYLPQMLDVSSSPEARQISQMSALWASNCFAPIAANIDKFKQQLSVDEIAVIETLARDHMARYGYERMTHTDAPIDEQALAAAHARSGGRRTEAWADLEQTNFRDFVLRRQRAEYLASVRERMERLCAARDATGPVAQRRLDVLTAAFEVTD